MQIALDAMGGDHAPGPIVAGAMQAVAADPNLRVLLVGDRAQVEPLLTAQGGNPDRFVHYEKYVQQLTPKDVQQAAKLLLDGKNEFVAIQMPENVKVEGKEDQKKGF